MIIQNSTSGTIIAPVTSINIPPIMWEGIELPASTVYLNHFDDFIYGPYKDQKTGSFNINSNVSVNGHDIGGRGVRCSGWGISRISVEHTIQKGEKAVQMLIAQPQNQNAETVYSITIGGNIGFFAYYPTAGLTMGTSQSCQVKDFSITQEQPTLNSVRWHYFQNSPFDGRYDSTINRFDFSDDVINFDRIKYLMPFTRFLNVKGFSDQSRLGTQTQRLSSQWVVSDMTYFKDFECKVNIEVHLACIIMTEPNPIYILKEAPDPFQITSDDSIKFNSFRYIRASNGMFVGMYEYVASTSSVIHIPQLLSSI